MQTYEVQEKLSINENSSLDININAGYSDAKGLDPDLFLSKKQGFILCATSWCNIYVY